MARGHSKKLFARNLRFFTLFPPLVCPCYFYMYPIPPQCTFILLSYHLSQKMFCDAYAFSVMLMHVL